MVTAIVLIKAEIHRIPEVAETIAQLPAVSEVYSITGDHDLVAIVRVRAHDELADVIPGGLNKVDGVTSTQTTRLSGPDLTRRPFARAKSRPVATTRPAACRLRSPCRSR